MKARVRIENKTAFYNGPFIHPVNHWDVKSQSQYTTSYTVAFLSPEPVAMNLSSEDISQLSTEDDSFDCEMQYIFIYLYSLR